MKLNWKHSLFSVLAGLGLIAVSYSVHTARNAEKVAVNALNQVSGIEPAVIYGPVEGQAGGVGGQILAYSFNDTIRGKEGRTPAEAQTVVKNLYHVSISFKQKPKGASWQEFLEDEFSRELWIETDGPPPTAGQVTRLLYKTGRLPIYTEADKKELLVTDFYAFHVLTVQRKEPANQLGPALDDR